MRIAGHASPNVHFPHIAAMLALAAMLFLFLIQTLAPQWAPPGAPAPVDLRPASKINRKIPSPSAPVDAYAPRFDMLATRLTLDGLLPRARSLENEAGHFAADCDLLWNAWRNIYGLQDNGLFFDPGSFLRAPAPDPEATQLSRLQMQLFRLDGRAATAARDADELVSRLLQAESRLAGIEETAGRLRAKGGGQEGAGPPLADLKAVLGGLARTMNALDLEIRDRQEDYDGILPLARKHINDRAGGWNNLPVPWHWRYLLSGKPRTPAQYDFDARYREYLQRALFAPLRR